GKLAAYQVGLLGGLPLSTPSQMIFVLPIASRGFIPGDTAKGGANGKVTGGGGAPKAPPDQAADATGVQVGMVPMAAVCVATDWSMTPLLLGAPLVTA